jgi:hypothetical protein
MTPDEKPEPGSLLAEIDGAQQRITKAAKVDVKTELSGNVYPLLRMLAEMSGNIIGLLEHRMTQAEVAIAELATIGESVVLPDLAAQIDDVFSIGLQLCQRIEATEDELTKKLIERYRNAVDAAREEISAVTLDDGDDEESDEEDTDAEG